MKILLTFFLVFSTMVVPGGKTYSYPVTVDHLVATLEAEKLEKAENWTESALAYETAYVMDAANIHALKKSGDMWLKAEDIEKAIAVYEGLTDNPAYKDLALRALAGIYGRAGDVEKAVYFLEVYQTATDRGLLKILLADPDFDRVRNDPAFQALIKRENDYQFPKAEWHPTWSPEGKRIAFVLCREGENGFEIYTVNTDGGELRRLTQNRYNETMLKWSPLGDEIAFVRAASDFQTMNGIYTINPDTGAERAVITIEVDYTNMPIGFSGPAWCPDGSCLVFIGVIDGIRQVFKVDPDGQNVVQLTNSPEAGKGNAFVAPDNQRVCYDVNKDGEWAYQNLYEIECVPLDRSMERETLLTGRYWWFPVWSYDGSVFISGIWESEQDRFGRLAIVDQETHEFEYITPPEMDSWWPAISPDNSQVVFGASKTPFGNDKRLYIMNIDGSDMRLLVP